MKTEKLIHKKIDDRALSYEAVLCTWTGLLVSAALTGYFFLMKMLGLYEVLWLRYFNAAFMVGGLLLTFFNYRNKMSPEGIPYLAGIRMGLRVTLTAIIPFAIFMAIYLRLDPSFMEYIIRSAEFGEYLTPGRAAGYIALEGFAGGAIMTYVMMPYFKSN